MSSNYVRSTFVSYMKTTFPTHNIVDVSGEYEIQQDFLQKQVPPITPQDEWTAIDYIGSDELPTTTLSNNTVGRYREIGSIFIHVVYPAKTTAKTDILNRCEIYRDTLRGSRINNDIVVESVTPPNFGAGASLDFKGGYISATFILSYYRDKNL